MKFNFKTQQFQTEAVESVVQVFNGQPNHRPESYLRDLGSRPSVAQSFFNEEMEATDDRTGYKNALISLSDKQLLANIHQIQARNNIKLSPFLVSELGRVSLDVEMETGTGKTYVYIKTMFELNARYGWSKFIVVVPSIAIREGVKKSFEITQEHFMELYGKKARFFVYNSSNLHQLDEFSSGFGINVMIINIQAFATSLKEDGKSKEARIIYSKRDEFASRRPIDVIKANRPIIILDEPQKMGGAATQNALKSNFNPLFSINYSATHRTQHNLVFVLDALDAYNRRLVKKIEVKGFEVKNLRGTDRYLYLESIIVSSKKPPMARLELEVKLKSGIKRETHTLGVGDNVYAESNQLEQYKEGYVIAEIDPIRGSVTFINGEVLFKGDVVGDVSEADMRRIQIRETIISHFEKEEKLFAIDIKCLSLFFIDEVAKYRQYDDNGNELLGEYGKMFEQEYTAILNERLTLFDSPYQEYLRRISVQETHRGYFSIDKTGRAVNSSVKRGSEFSDDISAYDLILKNKERLLSFKEPTRFIFSHSALREGWDNPNVFQICTLKHSDNTTAKRQEVGRGLRLCVNQAGDRQDEDVCGDKTVHEINLLTVIASESYYSFVGDLQKQIREVLYDRPSKATAAYFEGKTVMIGEEAHRITKQEADIIHRYLIKNDYVDYSDSITQEYRTAAESGRLAELPAELNALAEGIHTLVQGIFDESVLAKMIDNGNKPKVRENPLNDNFFKQEFKELWRHINHKYAYTVDFDSAELIKKAIDAINTKLTVMKLQYTLTTGTQSIDMDQYVLERGEAFDATKARTRTLDHAEASQVPYDLIGKIAEGTVLTRRTVAAILKGVLPEKVYLFRVNPEEYISKVIALIKEQKATMIVEHISYNQIDGSYDSNIFTVSKNSQEYEKAYRAQKHIQDFVFIDGTSEKSVERRFAEDLDKADEVCVYAKLPSGPKGFYIPTPVGHYSPDWAIAFKRGTVKHIFFIAETKGTMDSLNLKPIEQAKISCAKKLFNEISTSEVKYHDVDSYQSLLNIIRTL
ncbi:MAG: type III restriction-modification system endonuclease [Desulfitobacteriia bacterium]|jgi:type III restriction enzyme